MAAPAPDMSVVPEPADVVAIVRWKSPAVTFQTIQQWFGVPIPVEDISDELFHAPQAAAALALDAPVDLVVALDPKAPDRDPQPFVGFSVGMRSVDQARHAFERHGALQEVGPGTYRLELGRHQDRVSCLLGPSLGPSPARLVCGPRERDAEALQPYMARGLAAAPLPTTDIHGEVRFGPVQRRFGPMLPSALQMGSSFLSHEIGTGDRALDRATTDAVSGVTDEVVALVNDLDGVQVDLALEQGARVVSGDMSLKFKSRTSWTAQRMFENEGKMGAPPELYWALPAAADAAFYNRGMDGKPYEGIRRVGGDLIRAAMAHEKLPTADSDAVARLFQEAFQSWPVSVSASGHIDTPVGAQARPGDLDAMQKQLSGAMGWQMFGLEEKPDRLDKWLRDFAAAYNRPAIQRWFATQAHLDAKKLPKIRYGATTVRGLTGVKALEVTMTVDRSEFGHDGTPQPKNAKPLTLAYTVLVMADGQRTWMAMGADRPTLEKRLAEVKAGAHGAGTLSARSGLEALRSERTLTGGFMSIAGVASQAAGGLLSALEGHHMSSSDLNEILDVLAKMPHHGETPIIITSTARDGSPSEVTMRFRASKGTIDDIASLTAVLADHAMMPPTMVAPPPPPAPPPPRH